MLKHIKIAGFILCFTLCFLIYGGYLYSNYVHLMSKGNYFFEKTRAAHNVSAFVLENNKGQKLTLEKKNKFWRIKEADDYFADFSRINSFIKNIRNTIIYRNDFYDDVLAQLPIENALSITSLDEQGRIIDHALIAPKKEKNQFHYAILNDQSYLYQLEGIFNFSLHAMDWVKMPLLTIAQNRIKQIKFDNFNIYRRFATEKLHSDDIQDLTYLDILINNIWYLSAINIVHATHFDHNVYPIVKKYEITTFDGIIYHLDILSDKNKYWISIQLDKDNIISAEGAKIIEENLSLYDGWFFELDPQIGERIAYFTL